MNKIVLPFPPYSANHAYFINTKTRSRHPKKETKIYWQTIGWNIKVQIEEPYEYLKEVIYTFYWPDNRKRDFDNHVKIVADGLKGVLFKDDSWKHVGQKIQRTGGINRDNPCVVVEWKE